VRRDGTAAERPTQREDGDVGYIYTGEDRRTAVSCPRHDELTGTVRDLAVRMAKQEECSQDNKDWQRRQNGSLQTIEQHLRAQGLQVMGILLGVVLAAVAGLANVWISIAGRTP
jgi:hypothetical protein